MLVPFQDTPVEVEQNTDLPEYLPEDESPSKEQDKAVSRVGSHPEGAASWLSSAANFLSRSFYWWLWVKAYRTVWTNRGPVFHWCGELPSAICNKLSQQIFRLHKTYAVFYILLDIWSFRPVRKMEAFVNALALTSVLVCFIASLFNMGPWLTKLRWVYRALS